MIANVLQFGAGLLAANVGEWVIHRYVLHGLGRKKGSFWSFHWNEHHRACRKNGFYDPDYDRSPLTWNAQAKELLGLLTLSVAVVPLSALSWPTVFGMWSSMGLYYVVHKSSHLSPEWARRWLKHHYDHHMVGNQQHSWCVTFPLTDYVMGTRAPQTRSPT